jgi:hypothetical protein
MYSGTLCGTSLRRLISCTALSYISCASRDAHQLMKTAAALGSGLSLIFITEPNPPVRIPGPSVG